MRKGAKGKSIEVTEQWVLWSLHQNLGGDIFALPVDALGLISLSVVEVHPHPQTNDEDGRKTFNAGSNTEGNDVGRRPFVKEDLGCGNFSVGTVL